MEKRTSNLFLLLLVFVVLTLYIQINRFTNSSAHVHSIPLDARIPFVPLAIVPYLSFFLLMPWTLFSFLSEREQLYRQMCYSIIIVCLVSYSIYLLYQTTITRPTVTELGFIDSLVSFVYRIDPPYSCFPSLHSSISTIIAVHWVRSRSRTKYLVLFWSVIIIVSTLMTKQHYLLDVVGGITLGILISAVVARLSGFVGSHQSVPIGEDRQDSPQESLTS
jgi:membrane-associated phospholipid phosphatase